VRRSATIALCAAVALVDAACAPRETPVQRVSRIRRQFRIEPNGYQARRAVDGAPEVVVSVLVLNGGRDSLPRLTLRVHVQDAGGRDRASALAAVDTSGLVPGVTGQLSAIARGLEVDAGESLLVELENEPPAAELAGYAEYGDPAAGAPGSP
jgi:hypothetical protein